MPLTWSAYYGLARVQDGGPETKNWAVLYSNPQQIALMFKSLEQHHHNAATPMPYPGQNLATPATPVQGTLTQQYTSGNISAGISVGVRFSFIDQLGLETAACPEINTTFPATASRPDTPTVGPATATPVPGLLTGGTFVYGLTKGKSGGETDLSNVVTVTVPYDANGSFSYVVPIQLAETVSQYNAVDGTDTINFYRSTGYDAAFSQIASFTLADDPNTTQYIDNNTILAQTGPPQSPTFGSTNSLLIDWTGIAIPSVATRFRVYVTQQPGIYGATSLLQDYLINNPATPLPNNYVYQGTETLITDYPKEFSQGIGAPPPVYLPTEAIGAPYYTQPANAQGWQTWNFVFPVGGNNSTPIQGAAYLDPTSHQLKVALATPAVPGGPVTYMTLAAAGQGYAHPTTESGGHLASHIYAAPTGVGGPTQDLFNNLFSTPVGNTNAALFRKQATTTYKATATPATLQNSSQSAWLPMPDMVIGPISPDFLGQQVEFVFGTQAYMVPVVSGQAVSFQLYADGVAIGETLRTVGSSANNAFEYGTVSFTYATPLTKSNTLFQVYWMVSYPGYVQAIGTNIVGQPPSRYFSAKEIW